MFGKWRVRRGRQEATKAVEVCEGRQHSRRVEVNGRVFFSGVGCEESAEVRKAEIEGRLQI